MKQIAFLLYKVKSVYDVDGNDGDFTLN